MNISLSDRITALWVVLVFVVGVGIVMVGASQSSTQENSGAWSVAFLEPEWNSNIDFAIENHSSGDAFSYVLTLGNEVLVEEELVIPHGERITRDLPEHELIWEAGRVTVEVTGPAGEARNIYRRSYGDK